jgi:4-hydroxy-4-methyl-2-oxoglutarate aldolase
MFDVRAMPEQASPDLIARAQRVEPATIGHFRFRGFPAPNIRPVGSPKRIAGTAVTLALPASDSTLLHYAAGIIRPGDILIIDRLGDKTHACLGGGVAISLMRFGLTGVIIDGPCTDPEEIRDSGLPVWAAGVSPITTRVGGLGGAMNVPVSIGGAVVMPGDIVIADEAGIVILPPGEALADIDRALGLQLSEPAFIGRVSRETPLGELTGANALVESKLSDRS